MTLTHFLQARFPPLGSLAASATLKALQNLGLSSEAELALYGLLWPAYITLLEIKVLGEAKLSQPPLISAALRAKRLSKKAFVCLLVFLFGPAKAKNLLSTAKLAFVACWGPAVRYSAISQSLRLSALKGFAALLSLPEKGPNQHAPRPFPNRLVSFCARLIVLTRILVKSTAVLNGNPKCGPYVKASVKSVLWLTALFNVALNILLSLSLALALGIWAGRLALSLLMGKALALFRALKAAPKATSPRTGSYAVTPLGALDRSHNPEPQREARAAPLPPSTLERTAQEDTWVTQAPNWGLEDPSKGYQPGRGVARLLHGVNVPVWPFDTLTLLGKVAQELELRKQLTAHPVYLISIRERVALRFEARLRLELLKARNRALVSLNEFGGCVGYGYRYAKSGYLSTRARAGSWKKGLGPRSANVALNVPRHGPLFKLSGGLFLYEPNFAIRYFFPTRRSAGQTLEAEWLPFVTIEAASSLPYSTTRPLNFISSLALSPVLRANFYVVAASKPVGPLLKPAIAMGRFVWSQIPWSPPRNLSVRLEKVAGAAFGWSSVRSLGYHYSCVDLALVGAYNFLSLVRLNRAPSSKTRKKGRRRFRGALALAVTLVYIFLTSSLLWLYLFPPRGLHGLTGVSKPWDANACSADKISRPTRAVPLLAQELLAIRPGAVVDGAKARRFHWLHRYCAYRSEDYAAFFRIKTSGHYLGLGTARRWAVKTIAGERWAEKARLWPLSYAAFGFAQGSFYFSNSFTNTPSRPWFFTPRWAYPFKGRYYRYNDPHLLWQKVKLMLSLARDSISRLPNRALTYNKRCGPPYIGSRLVKNSPKVIKSAYKVCSPVHPFSVTPWAAVMATTPYRGWKNLWKNLNFCHFLRFWDLWIYQKVPGAAYNVKFYIAKPLLNLVRASHNLYCKPFFNTRGLISYFTWKNTHPCNNLRTTWTCWLQPPHWGALRPSVSPLHLLKHGFCLLRFVLVGYRFKTILLPLLKTHLWLYYLYPLANVIGAYPSLMEPAPLAIEMGGGATLASSAYRLWRLTKVVVNPIFLWKSCNHARIASDSVTEVNQLTLNALSSVGLEESGASDLNCGLGGYWGVDQTGGLIDKYNNIRPLLQTLETSAFASYLNYSPSLHRVIYPHPTAPMLPPFQKPLDVLCDKAWPRGNEYLEPMTVINSWGPSNLDGGAASVFYAKFKTSESSPNGWGGAFSNGLRHGGKPPSIGNGLGVKESFEPGLGLNNPGRYHPSPGPRNGPLSFWQRRLEAPFETQHVRALAERGGWNSPSSGPCAGAHVGYPLSFENLKNKDTKGTKGTKLDSTLLSRLELYDRRYTLKGEGRLERRKLEPTDLRLRKIYDRPVDELNLDKRIEPLGMQLAKFEAPATGVRGKARREGFEPETPPDFLGTFKGPVRGYEEDLGASHKPAIISNMDPWTLDQGFPFFNRGRLLRVWAGRRKGKPRLKKRSKEERDKDKIDYAVADDPCGSEVVDPSTPRWDGLVEPEAPYRTKVISPDRPYDFFGPGFADGLSPSFPRFSDDVFRHYRGGVDIWNDVSYRERLTLPYISESSKGMPRIRRCKWGSPHYVGPSNGPVHSYLDAPYQYKRQFHVFRRPTEVDFFQGTYYSPRPSCLDYYARNPYRTDPRHISDRLTRLFERHEPLSSNSFLLKIRRRGGVPNDYEAHPSFNACWTRTGLNPYWTRTGLNPLDMPVGNGLHSKGFMPPSHDNREVRAFALDALSVVHNWVWGVWKLVNETFFSWSSVPSSLSTVAEFLSLPTKILGSIWWKACNQPSLNILPNLKVKQEPSSLWGFVDFFTQNNCYVYTVVPLTWFALRLISKCIRWNRWWERQENGLESMFHLSWGGISKIGDFFFYVPFYTLPLVEMKAFPVCMEPPSRLKAWEIEPDSKLPVGFKRRLKLIEGWTTPKNLWILPSIVSLKEYLNTPRTPFIDVFFCLGKRRWFGLRTPHLWDYLSFEPREPLNLVHRFARTDYHFRIIPVWLLRLLFPSYGWGFVLPFELFSFHPWEKAKLVPPLGEGTGGIRWRHSSTYATYQNFLGHTCVKGDFQAWRWYPTKPFSGTLLLLFKQGWPALPSEYHRGGASYFLRANDSSTSFFDHKLPKLDDTASKHQNLKAAKATLLPWVTPLSFMLYMYPQNRLFLKDHPFWLALDSLSALARAMAAPLPFLLLSWFPACCRLLFPQPPGTNLYDLLCSKDGPAYAWRFRHRRSSWIRTTLTLNFRWMDHCVFFFPYNIDTTLTTPESYEGQHLEGDFVNRGPGGVMQYGHKLSFWLHVLLHAWWNCYAAPWWDRYFG